MACSQLMLEGATHKDKRSEITRHSHSESTQAEHGDWALLLWRMTHLEQNCTRLRVSRLPTGLLSTFICSVGGKSVDTFLK